MLPINSFAMRMAKLGTVILIFAHTNACLQLLVGKVEPANNNWLLAEGVYDASKWTQVGGCLCAGGWYEGRLQHVPGGWLAAQGGWGCMCT